ncbi:hypothetical protein IWX90DRAFT_274573 [Phyllosticta citrichinensis]|uniref:Uncharacterized protein n=1 Tax=Phyllosticta citrichinensis TaxID=1130410 RepID=A0ABR1XN10_9PEZI
MKTTLSPVTHNFHIRYLRTLPALLLPVHQPVHLSLCRLFQIPPALVLAMSSSTTPSMPPNTDEDRRWAPLFMALMKRDGKADFSDELNRLIPDPADKDAFIAWNSTCVAKAYERNFKPPPRDSFVKLVEELNFFFPGEKRKEYSRWHEPLAVVPWIPLGSTENALHRLEPDFYCFHARNQYHTDHPRPMPPCFFGVNKNVSPNFPKTGDRPRENVSALIPNWYLRPADADSSSPALNNYDNPNASQRFPSTMPANTDENRR